MTIDKAALRKLASEATAGPWKSDQSWNNGGMSLSDFTVPGHNGGATVELLSVDAAFIAAARTAVPDLLDQLDLAEAECGELRKQAVSCGGQGCGTDESKACLRCCRVMLSNYNRNHGEQCDAIQQRMRSQANDLEWDRQLLREQLSACRAALATANAEITRMSFYETTPAAEVIRMLRAKEKELVAMTAARDEACDLLNEQRPSALSGSEWHVTEQIAALRSVGQPK